MEIYRVVRGMEVPGERLRLGDGNRGEAVVEVRVLRGREYYDARAGCEYSQVCSWCPFGEDGTNSGGEVEEEEEEDLRSALC